MLLVVFDQLLVFQRPFVTSWSVLVVSQQCVFHSTELKVPLHQHDNLLYFRIKRANPNK
jgi:hypothetical protein